MRTGNPVLGETTFSEVRAANGATMTLQGTAQKTLLLLALAVVGASMLWSQVLAGDLAGAGPWALGGMLASLVIAIVLRFKMHWAPALAPAYAVAEGLFLGAISGLMELRYPGIVMQAVLATGGTLLVLLLAYWTRLIKPTENFKLTLVAATGGIGIVYLVGMIGSFFGWQIPYIHESGAIGIGFSVFVVVIAALNLVLDFDYIENAAAAGAPKRMEWYAAFALLVTLAWTYIEILKLLAKLRRR